MLLNAILPAGFKTAGLSHKPMLFLTTAAFAAIVGASGAQADDLNDRDGWNHHGPTKWVASWTTAAQGVLKSQPGSPAPNLSFSIPDFTVGVKEQTLRQIIKPDFWGNEGRLRLTNLFGTQPVTFGAVTVGWQGGSGNITPGTLRRATFGGQAGVTIPAGKEIYSDPFELVAPNQSGPSFGHDERSNSSDPVLDGRKLAVNLYVKGSSGPITYHAAAFQTSYLSAPGSGDHTRDNDDSAYPYTTISWFFLGALEVKAPAETKVVVATGASVVDGTSSTLNGNDRWSDDLSRRLHEAYGRKISVVNTGLAGDTAALPPAGANRSLGAYFQERLDRDAINIAGATDIILYDGPNDYGSYLLPASLTTAAYQSIVARVHAAGLNIYGATLSSPKGDPNGYYSSPGGLANRLLVNDFIRTSGLFDGVEDFDAATLDPATGAIQPQFVPNTTTGAAGDFLHPNRAGYQAEANAIDLRPFAPRRH